VTGFAGSHDVADVLTALTGDRLLAVFDCDGTLAPIAAVPAAAQVPAAVRRDLQRLARRPGFQLAVISGRPLAEVQELVGVQPCLYAGVHGLDLAGTLHPAPIPQAQLLAVRLLARVLAARWAGTPGIIVEDKAFAVAVHYRAATPDVARQARVQVRALAATTGGQVRALAGKKVVEVRPAAFWDKGTCLHWMWRQLEERTGERWQVLYAGDDATDEDVFRRFPPPALTIAVGRRRTAARWRLATCAQVAELIARLAAADAGTLTAAER